MSDDAIMFGGNHPINCNCLRCDDQRKRDEAASLKLADLIQSKRGDRQVGDELRAAIAALQGRCTVCQDEFLDPYEVGRCGNDNCYPRGFGRLSADLVGYKKLIDELTTINKGLVAGTDRLKAELATAIADKVRAEQDRDDFILGAVGLTPDRVEKGLNKLMQAIAQSEEKEEPRPYGNYGDLSRCRTCGNSSSNPPCGCY